MKKRLSRLDKQAVCASKKVKQEPYGQITALSDKEAKAKLKDLGQLPHTNLKGLACWSKDEASSFSRSQM